MGLGGGSIELNNMGVLHKNGAVFKGAKCLFAGSSQPFLHVSRGWFPLAPLPPPVVQWSAL